MLTRSTLTIVPRTEIGADFYDLDPRALTPAQAQTLKEAVDEHKVLVFHGVDLADDEQGAMARKFGVPQRCFQRHCHHPQWPEIFVSNSVPVDGTQAGNGTPPRSAQPDSWVRVDGTRGVAEPCYIAATGRFNAVEANISFHQTGGECSVEATIALVIWRHA